MEMKFDIEEQLQLIAKVPKAARMGIVAAVLVGFFAIFLGVIVVFSLTSFGAPPAEVVLLFMLGAGYALSRGVHIRADFLYRNWSARTQGIVDMVLYLTLYFTGMVCLMWYGTEYALNAWMRGERAMDTAWMPMLGPVRTAIPVGVFLLILQGISETLKSWYAATRGRWPT